MQAIVVGYYGFGNVGDEALLLSLIQMLPDHVEPIVLSYAPEITAATYEVKACPRWNGVAIGQCLRQVDALIWGGGSLLQDRTSWRSLIYYTGLMGVAQQMNRITVAWAQGLGPLDRRWTQWLARQCLRECDRVSVRDPVAAEQLEIWGIPHQVGVDPVWALTPASRPEWQNLPDPMIAVVLRDHPHLTPTRYQHLATALVAFQQITGTYVLLIPFQLPPTEPIGGADYTIAEQLHQQLPSVSQIVTLRDPRELMGLFQRVRWTLTMRYHGLVMAAAGGSRCFGLSYDPKVKTLLQVLQMAGWDLEQIPEDPQAICRSWIESYEQGRALGSVELEEWRSQARIHAGVLTEVLGQDP